MDSIMAKYYTSQDSKYASALTVIDGVKLTTEQYGRAARKGSALIYYINNALVELSSKDGALQNCLPINSVSQATSASMKATPLPNPPTHPTGIT